MSNFSEGQFTKTNTRPVTNKKCRTTNQTTIFDRMANSKMKGNNVTNSKLHVSNLKEGDDIILKDRTKSYRAKTNKQRCHMRLALILNPKNGRWFLHSDSCLQHEFHYKIPTEASVLGSSDLSDSEEKWVEEMYNMGLSNGTIAGVMTGYFKKKGRQGQFQRTGIKNITYKYTKEMNLLSGIEADMSQADKTLRELNSRGISHVCLTMAQNGDLVVYKNKGRPNAEELMVMACSDKIRIGLQKLRDELSGDHGNEILVALSIASDQMMRHVHMFPETWFMDVTVNTNKPFLPTGPLPPIFSGIIQAYFPHPHTHLFLPSNPLASIFDPCFIQSWSLMRHSARTLSNHVKRC